jgi:hydrogenase maturation protein HypF
MTPGGELSRDPDFLAIEIRVRGRVQGVGFRPTVWRMARELDLSGEVMNDAEGVLVRVGGEATAVNDFVGRIAREPPPLARIDAIETKAYRGRLSAKFRIAESRAGAAHTQVAPDAAICPECAAEIANPRERRFRYPFANCTHCGPRLSIIVGIPYDRARTTMAPFPMCDACAREYRDPADRRFHAEAIACHACGPRARLIRFDGRGASIDQHSALDEVDAAGALLRKGEIVAIKGLGGFHLACDATNAGAVARLRQSKRRERKPFALMAADVEIIRRYCAVSADEERLMGAAAAPIVLLSADGPRRLPDDVAPGLAALGFMLPTTPLHALMLRGLDRPVVMTSGNVADEPQATDNDEARERLAGIAPYALIHNRAIANRVDDSLVRVMVGKPRLLRRARGYAPAPLALPPGFEAAPSLLATGGELKATFCLVKDGQAILSQHQGDLENAETFEGYRRALALYAELFDHSPVALVADKHPEYLSAKLARARAASVPVALIEVQHHHAHVAACLAENLYPLDAPPVLGIVLDGLGWGDDGTIWGGEFLLTDYRSYQRLGLFKPVAMPGGAQAAREPWRNLYAHLTAEMGWAHFETNFAGLELFADLQRRPRATLDAMIRHGVNAPKASSCGRLFDAVAAALNLCRDRQAYEGEAAARLEAIVDGGAMARDPELAYPFAILDMPDSGLPYLEPAPMWRAILADLGLGAPPALIAARFHKGLAQTVVAMARKLAEPDDRGAARFDTIALSGGCFQNRVLFEEVVRGLERTGFRVLAHAEVPANDGGLSLGQAAIGAARLIDAANVRDKSGRTMG